MTAATVEPTPVDALSYTDASRELDSIVQFFEQREVDVDVLVARLERATALIDELDRRLRHTRTQVEELVPRLDTLAREVETGMFCINTSMLGGGDSPFGGVKWSGHGHEDGSEGVMACLVLKAVHEG